MSSPGVGPGQRAPSSHCTPHPLLPPLPRDKRCPQERITTDNHFSNALGVLGLHYPCPI